MALRFSAKRGSLSTRVDRSLNPRKEHRVELNILNEVAALERLTVGQLRQRFAELFGEATQASNRTCGNRHRIEDHLRHRIQDHGNTILATGDSLQPASRK